MPDDKHTDDYAALWSDCVVELQARMPERQARILIGKVYKILGARKGLPIVRAAAQAKDPWPYTMKALMETQSWTASRGGTS